MTTTSNLLTTGTPDTPFVTVTSHSVIGTPAPMPTAHPKWFLSSIATYPATTVSTPPPTPTPTPSSQPSTISGVPTEWKVLGIAVIAISVLGISVLCIVFFDTWWRFIKDVLCCGMGSKDSGGEEELVPDWEKRSWAVQLRDEGGCGGSHRYPSVEDLTAPEGVLCRKPSVKERQEGLGVLFPSRGNLFDDIISEPTEAYGISRGRVTATRTSQYETAPHANVGEIYPPKLSPSPTMTEAYGGIAA
ncbi:hypothetical protein JAAARDRAFT_29264 [Jaapia argillacea MUCL 33604]|uniref:Uncharacterized protein n=1 Tax=Jaapia argillacea MUCL 33604 TaxID=933084 RepID=A0A067Q8D5_9AGAM|nr:hypothetical protein JAAARDRAFT_29264 [Jaapia argillacea MUCL 33604]